MHFVQVNLERAGYEVITANSAQEALIRIATEPPTVVVIDISLPDMTGDAFARMLRQRHPRPLVLLMLAKASDPKVVKRWVGSADSYVTKPFNPLELIATIVKLLNRQASPDLS